MKGLTRSLVLMSIGWSSISNFGVVVELTGLVDDDSAVMTAVLGGETTLIEIGAFSSQVLGISGAATLTASTDGAMINSLEKR
jgi:hypothetical protein